MDIRCAPCEVCGSASSGFHFGVLACEGCKGFYRRAVKFNLAESYKCLTGQNDCEVSQKSRKCQKCRYSKCVSVGMAPEASRTGRPTKVRQAEIRQQLEQLKTENKLLPAPATLPPHLQQQQRERMERQANKIAKKAAKLKAKGLIVAPDRQSGASSSMTDAMDTTNTTSLFNVPTSPDGPSAGNETATDLSMGTPLSNVSIDPALSKQLLDSFAVSTPSSVSAMESPFNRMEAASAQPSSSNDAAAASFFGLNAAASSSSALPVPLPELSGAEITLRQRLILEQARLQVEIEEKQKQIREAASLSEQDQRGRSATPPSQSGSIATILLSSPNASGFREYVTPARDLTSLTLDQLTRIVREDARCANAMLWMYNSGRDWFNADLASLFGGPPVEDPYLLYRRYILPMQAANQSPLSLSLPQAEPSPLSFLPSLVSARTEWLLQRVVKSTAYLSKIQSTRTILTETNLELADVWRRLLSGFELNAVHMINFIKSLPGFTHIDLQDRILLTTHAMMPLLFAQLSLDFDPNTETVNFFSMSRETAETVFANYAGPGQLFNLEIFRRHFVDAGYAIKSSSLTVVEFGLLCALIFFNTAIPGIKDVNKVETVRLELTHASEAFIFGNFPSESPDGTLSMNAPPPPLPNSSPLASVLNATGPSASNWPPVSSVNMTNATNRLNNFRSLLSYFRNLNLFASWLRGLTLTVHPQLVECSGQVFREMHAQMEASIRRQARADELQQLNQQTIAATCSPQSNHGAMPSTSTAFEPPMNLFKVLPEHLSLPKE